MTIYLPFFCSDREMSQEARSGSGEGIDTNSAILAQSVLVSNPVGKSDRHLLDPATFQPDNYQPKKRDTPNDSSEQLSVSRLQSFRNNIQGHVISDDSFKVITAAWRRGTEKSYSSAWGKWMLWCNQTEIDPYKHLSDCVEFSNSAVPGRKAVTVFYSKLILLSVIRYIALNRRKTGQSTFSGCSPTSRYV